MSGIETFELNDAENERLRKLYVTVREMGQSFIRTTPGNCMLPTAYEKCKEEIFNLQLRPDDIYLLTWLKNGTTWTQEMVWMIQNDCDLQKAKSISPLERIPFFDVSFLFDFMEPKIPGISFEEIIALIKAMPSSRIIKSHLPYCLLPPNILDQCKVVTCLRNPKDTVVSFYHHEKLLKCHSFCGDFAEYFDLFMDDLVVFSSYWSYTLEAWKNRNHPNLCLLFFEDMKKDLASSIRKVAEFLHKELTEEQIKYLAENLSFKKMKRNASDNEDMMKKVFFNDDGSGDQSFFRKGDVGSWKNYFTEEMNQRMDEAIVRHFKGTGLEFRYE